MTLLEFKAFFVSRDSSFNELDSSKIVISFNDLVAIREQFDDPNIPSESVVVDTSGLAMSEASVDLSDEQVATAHSENGLFDQTTKEDIEVYSGFLSKFIDKAYVFNESESLYVITIFLDTTALLNEWINLGFPKNISFGENFEEE